MDAALRHRVHVRRLRKGMAHETHRVVAMVIREDEDDVAGIRLRDFPGGLPFLGQE